MAAQSYGVVVMGGLVTNSTDAVHWLMERGVKFLPN